MDHVRARKNLGEVEIGFVGQLGGIPLYSQPLLRSPAMAACLWSDRGPKILVEVENDFEVEEAEIHRKRVQEGILAVVVLRVSTDFLAEAHLDHPDAAYLDRLGHLLVLDVALDRQIVVCGLDLVVDDLESFRRLEGHIRVQGRTVVRAHSLAGLLGLLSRLLVVHSLVVNTVHLAEVPYGGAPVADAVAEQGAGSEGFVARIRVHSPDTVPALDHTLLTTALHDFPHVFHCQARMDLSHCPQLR